MKVTLFTLFALFFLTGCATFGTQVQTPVTKTINKSTLITMKTKKFAFSDSGFYKNTPNMISIQAYSSGVGIGEMKFYKDNNTICVGKLCNTRKWFTENFLSKEYPYDLIVKVLDKKPIFSGKNLQKTADGFIQNIGAIKYRVSPSEIYFKDRANRIIIKIKDM